MPGPQIGEAISIRCEVKPGPFSGERLVTVETVHGPISGFVREGELQQKADGWYVRGVVRRIEQDALEVWIRGSFFTTNGIASVPRHAAMAV